MRRTTHLAFLLFLVAGPLFTIAQAPPKLVIDSPVVAVPDTLLYNQGAGDKHIDYKIRLRNVGGLGATGLVDIIFRYKDSVDQVKLTLPIDLENQQFIDTTITDTVMGTNLRYGGGVNIIQIWPRAHPDVMASDPDTTLATVFIDGFLGRPTPGGVFDRVELYPNPASDVVKVRYKKSNSRLELVRIINLEGREVYQNTLPITELPFAEQPPGIYFVEFVYADHERGLFKVIVQH